MVQLKIDRVGDEYLLEEDGQIYIYRSVGHNERSHYYVVGPCRINKWGSVVFEQNDLILYWPHVYPETGFDRHPSKVPALWRDRVTWLEELLRWSS